MNAPTIRHLTLLLGAILGLGSQAFPQQQLLQPKPVPVGGWPEIFDPQTLLHLNLSMSNTDWNTVQHDTSNEIEVPATFWLQGEAPILVSVRKKSSDALDAGTGFLKVSLKIDINELVSGQVWHDLKKLSLENGDDEDVLTEGLAWNLHRMAASPQGYSYSAALANWATLTINGVYTGVYVNVEQRDKTMLQNRGLWVGDETWLYKIDDIYTTELDEGSGASPAYQTLCYDPFQRPDPDCPTPDNGVLEPELNSLIDMQGMLTLASVEAFIACHDGLFSKGKNAFFADSLSGFKRLYFPWDLDSVLTQLNHDIYNPGDHYADIVLGVPAFRDQYRQIFTDLLDVPLQEAAIHSFLDAVRPVLRSWIALDPNNQIGTAQDVDAHFQAKKNWISQRIPIVRAQLSNG